MDLGAFLVTLHTPRPPGSLRLVVESWTHTGRSMAAWRAHAEQRGSSMVEWRDEDAPAPPAEHVEVLELWLAADGAERLDVRDADGALVRRQVTRGGRWWSWWPAEGARSNEDDPGVTSGSALDELGPALSGWSLAGLLRFEDPGTLEHADRRLLTALGRVRANLRHGDDWPLHRIGMGVEELWLAVDPATGVVVRAEARRGGEVLRRWTVRALEIGADVEAELVFESPDGAPVRGIREDRPEHVALHEAGRGLDFTVWVAQGLGERFDATATRFEDAGQTHVSLHYHAHIAGYSFGIFQAPAGAPRHGFQPRTPWQSRTVDGLELEVHEDDRRGMDGGFAVVRLVRDGTQLELQADGLGLDALVRIAVGLAPAPDGPPS